MKNQFMMRASLGLLSVLSLGGLFGCVSLGSDRAASPSSIDLSPDSLGSVVEGTKDGGGGKGVLCPDGLRSLDLYEAQEVHHYPIDPNPGNLDENLKIYQARMAAYFSELQADPLSPSFQKSALEMMRWNWMDRMKDIPSEDTLVFSDDATLPALKPGCSFVQIVLYQPDGLVLRDRKLWDQLDAQNQAAILLHEELYEFARGLHEKTSDDTRKIVGLTFANRLPRPIFEKAWTSKRVAYCIAGKNSLENPGYHVFAIEQEMEGQNGVMFIFLMSHSQAETSQASLGKLTAFLPGLSLDRLVNADFHRAELTIHDELFGKNSSFQIQPFSDVSTDTTIQVSMPGVEGLWSSVSEPEARFVRFSAIDEHTQQRLVSDGFCTEFDQDYPLKGDFGISYLMTFVEKLCVGSSEQCAHHSAAR